MSDEVNETVDQAPAEEAPVEQEPKVCPLNGSCECDCPCTKVVGVFQTSTLMQKFEEIYKWRNLIKSAITFASVFTLLLLCSKFHFSLLTIVSFSLLISILIGFIFSYGTRAYYKYIMKSDETIDPFQGVDAKINISEETIKEFSDFFTSLFSALFEMFGVLFTWKLPKRSVMFSCLMLVAFFIGKKTTGATVLLIFWVYLFTWPKIYELQHEKIDELFGKVKAIVGEQIEKVKAKLQEAQQGKKKKD